MKSEFERKYDANYAKSCAYNFIEYIGNKIKVLEKELYGRGFNIKEWYKGMKFVEESSVKHFKWLFDGNAKDKSEINIIKKRLEETLNGKVLFGKENFVATSFLLYEVNPDYAGLLATFKGSTTEIHEKEHRKQKYGWPKLVSEADAIYQSIIFWDENRFSELSDVEALRLYSSLKFRHQIFEIYFIHLIREEFKKYSSTQKRSFVNYFLGPIILHGLVNEGMNYSDALSNLPKIVKLVEEDLFNTPNCKNVFPKIKEFLSRTTVLASNIYYPIWNRFFKPEIELKKGIRVTEF
jgi:hypothetical protein